MFGNDPVSLSTADDVFLSNTQNGQTIQYNSSTAKWNNATPSTTTTIANVSGLQTALDAKLATADLQAALRATDALVFYNTGTSSYPLRSSVTSDAQRRVRWIGPVAPTSGGSYAVPALDVWEATA